jgi:ferredoxin-NADP reductase
MERIDPGSGPTAAARIFSGCLAQRRPLSSAVYEIEWPRPPGFSFLPGQRIRLRIGPAERDYTLVSAPADQSLRICFRRIAGGELSPRLAQAPIGSPFRFTGPHGYFVYRPSPRPAVFVATGVGIAPFCSMAASGISGFTLLHGTRSREELYYRSAVAPAAAAYIPCLSGPDADAAGAFTGRVTGYIESRLAPGCYDFYLCGSQAMVKDVTLLVDERFAGSWVYSEVFF